MNVGSGISISDEYRETGMVAESFNLHDVSILHHLISDYQNSFEEQIAAVKAAGQNQVPYAITDSIRKVAHDQAIMEVVGSILDGEPWVMWGANIQKGTPNQAYEWHIDFESKFFDTITVMIGLEGCRQENATTCIPYTHLFDYGPGRRWHDASKNEIIDHTQSIDSRCDRTVQFEDFANGKFYVFNARCWHAGDVMSSKERMILILHYHKASDPRIPFMTDYVKGTWQRNAAAPYLVQNGYEKVLNLQLGRPAKNKTPLMRRVRRRLSHLWGGK